VSGLSGWCACMRERGREEGGTKGRCVKGSCLDFLRPCCIGHHCTTTRGGGGMCEEDGEDVSSKM